MKQYDLHALDQHIQNNEQKELLHSAIMHQPSLQTNLQLPGHIKFGLEIEFEDLLLDSISQIWGNITKQLSNTKWYVKRECSIGLPNLTRYETQLNRKKNGVFYFSNSLIPVSESTFPILGGEITSPPLSDSPENWEDLKKMLSLLTKMKAAISHGSSGHIHFDKHIFKHNRDHLYRFLLLWIRYEKICFRFSYGEHLGRRNGIPRHAKPIRYHLFSLLPTLKKQSSYESLVRFLVSPPDRAINFNNLSDPIAINQTIEFRLPNGSLNPIVWQSRVHFFAKLLLASTNFNLDIEALEHALIHQQSENFYIDDLNFYDFIDVKSALELCEMVFEQPQDKLLFLKLYLKEYKVPTKEEEYLKTFQL